MIRNDILWTQTLTKLELTIIARASVACSNLTLNHLKRLLQANYVIAVAYCRSKDSLPAINTIITV